MPRLPAPPTAFPARVVATAHTFLDRLDESARNIGDDITLARIGRIRTQTHEIDLKLLQTHIS